MTTMKTVDAGVKAKAQIHTRQGRARQSERGEGRARQAIGNGNGNGYLQRNKIAILATDETRQDKTRQDETRRDKTRLTSGAPSRDGWVNFRSLFPSHCYALSSTAGSSETKLGGLFSFVVPVSGPSIVAASASAPTSEERFLLLPLHWAGQ